MSWLFAQSASLSHFVAAKFRTGLQHLISRGAKIEKVTESHILIQDIDEWLWQDAQTLDRLCKYQLINNVYSSVSTAPDGLNGIVVFMSIVQSNRLWLLWQASLSVLTCVVFFLWLNYVYLADMVSVWSTHMYILAVSRPNAMILINTGVSKKTGLILQLNKKSSTNLVPWKCTLWCATP